MELWLPGYEHDPEHGAGLGVTSGAAKVVIHTTETGPGSLNAVRRTWRGPANWGKGLPHFIAEGDRYVQMLPLNVGAYTLENKAGGADTNRCGPAIQIEIVGYARDEFNDGEYDALGRWLADLVRAGVPLDLAQHPRFYGDREGVVLARYDSPQRLSTERYHDFAGFMGHQHVPENAHWDPGRLDGDRVERIARAHLNPTPEEDDMALTVKCIHWTKPSSRWARDVAKIAANPDPALGQTAAFLIYDVAGTVRHITSPEHLNWLWFYQVEDRGFADDELFKSYELVGPGSRD